MALLFLLCTTIAAQEVAQRKPYIRAPEIPDWYLLEEGKKAFRAGDYGGALSFFESARNARKDYWTRHETNFISLMTMPVARGFKDDLSLAEKYAAAQKQFDAASAIEALFFHVGRDAVNDSVEKALEYFRSLKNYGEAEFHIGEVYQIEGEYAIALRQYEKALELNADAAWRLTILYKIAEVNRESRNYTAMEDALNTILKDDSLWNDSKSFVRTAMAATLARDGINKFLVMYRYKNAGTLRAHSELGLFYYVSGRYNLALEHLMFAALIENTAIIDEVKEKKFDFEFTTLDAMIALTKRDAALKTYIEDVSYYKTMYYLGAALFAAGSNAGARTVWRFVAGQDAAGEWQRRSRNQLVKPFITPVVPTP